MRGWALGTILLASCGAAPALLSASDAGPSCIRARADAFCDADHPCCDGAICDPANSVCREPSSCGQDGAGCSAELGCCGGLSCVNERCTVEPQLSGSGANGGGTSGGGGPTSTGAPGPGSTTAGPTGSGTGGGTGEPGPR